MAVIVEQRAAVDGLAEWAVEKINQVMGNPPVLFIYFFSILFILFYLYALGFLIARAISEWDYEWRQSINGI